MDLVELIARWDLVGPASTVIGGLLHGPGHTFLIDRACGMSPRAMEDHLRSRGVKTWGLFITGQGLGPSDTIALTVPKAQAAWATYLLEQLRVPVQNPVAPDHKGGRPAKARTAKRRSLLDQINEGIDGLGKFLS